MAFEELAWEFGEADVAKEVRGSGLEAVEEGEDAVAEGREVVGEAMEVEDVLLELAPELLDGVEPGGVGGERDELGSVGLERGRRNGKGDRWGSRAARTSGWKWTGQLSRTT